MKIALSLIAAASAVALALPAQAAPSAEAPCFYLRDMRNHTVGDEHTMYFDIGGRSVYRAVMSNNCLAATTSSDPIVLQNQTGTGLICHKLDFDIGVRGNRCIIASLTKLTPEEVAALPRKVKP
jgi:hypothetical protein